MTVREMREDKGRETGETGRKGQYRLPDREPLWPPEEPLAPRLSAYVKRDSYRKALGLPEEVSERYRPLAQGEYNKNYWFIHPATGKRLVFRINFGSQMHLKHQIEYEAHALQLLRSSGRTPMPLYTDGSRSVLPNGVMVMEYLPGKALDYRRHLSQAAECLADIHSTAVPENHGLIAPGQPLRAILNECEEMARTFMESPLAAEDKKKKLRRLLDLGWRSADVLGEPPFRCCINTELNSTNFLVGRKGEKTYLIDWEKPLYGEPAQDLGHFLAPTTTFWKTDVILEERETEEFIAEYIRQVNGRFDTAGIGERTRVYIPVTCLRGISWCAMAWVQYRQPGKAIVNETTAKKLEAYLNDAFLERIERLVWAAR